MPNDRIAAALTVIEAIAGKEERASVEQDLLRKNSTQIDGSLSIGGFRGPFKSEPETFRRSLVRAVLLARLARGALQPTAASQNITALMTRTTAALQNELLNLFPYKAYRGNFEKRKEWAPMHFTDPSKHTNSSYKYIVHTLMQAPSKVAEYNLGNATELENFDKLRQKYLPYAQVSKKNRLKPNLLVDFMAQYLADPHVIRQNIISSSVISDAKHATYYPVGFIMRVPPECIYITSPTDVGVANRTNDILGELQRRHTGTAMTIQTPDQVLGATTGAGGSTGYNEIVVVGTAPEGKQVDVIGIFVKTDANGNLYVSRNLTTQVPDTAAWLTPKSVELISECARKFNLPIVPIADSASVVLATPTPWPFGGTQTVVNARIDTGVRSPGGATRGRSGTM
jgi:hypothetical protein